LTGLPQILQYLGSGSASICGSKGQNINQKLQTKIFCSQTQNLYLPLNGSLSFILKITGKEEK